MWVTHSINFKSKFLTNGIIKIRFQLNVLNCSKKILLPNLKDYQSEIESNISVGLGIKLENLEINVSFFMTEFRRPISGLARNLVKR